MSAAFFLGGTSGCFLMPKGKVPPAPADSLVLRGDQLEPDAAAPAEGTAGADLAGAHEYYRQGDYEKAEKLFHRLAENTKNSPQMAEEARYYEAECLRRQEKYPKAADVYNRMLTDFPGGVHRDQAIRHMFEIANYWLDDTREEMRVEREKSEGKRWLVLPASFVHFEKSKPFLDEEGRAVEKLEQVQLNSLDGPLADQALFLLGSIKFFREDYRESDYHFSQLVDRYPNSPYASKAVELAIISKHMSTGGSDYDGRKVAEARELVYKAQSSYPELAGPKKNFLDRQLSGITLQQAEKDYKMAELYRRTGHPGSAYFLYEVVRRRYPSTPFFDKATERMHEMRHKLDKEGKKAGPITPPLKPGETPTTRQGLPELAPPPAKLPPVDRPDGAAPEQAPEPRKLPPVQTQDSAVPEQAPAPQRLPAPPGNPR